MKTALLRDIADIQTGPFGSQLHQEDYVDNGTPIVTVEHLGKRCFTTQNLPLVSDSDKQRLQKYTLRKGDIVFSRVGSVDRCSYVEYEHDGWMFSGRCLRVRPMEIVDSEYLYCYFCSEEAKQFVRNIAVGATMPSINTKLLGEVPIVLPDLQKQKKIATAMSVIDHKIQINERINDNLEQQIGALLMAFIDEETATPVRLGDFLYIKGRIGWKGLKKNEYLPESCFRIVNGETLTKAGIDWSKAGYITEERYLESPEIMLQVGDILLSKDGTIGKIGYVDNLDLPTSVASGIFVIRNSQPNKITTPFIYYLLKSKLFEAFIAARTEGSVIPHLYQKDFMDFVFPLPSLERMADFERLTSPMFFQAVNNLNENKALAATRDALLPRLMSGEIDVSSITI